MKPSQSSSARALQKLIILLLILFILSFTYFIHTLNLPNCYYSRPCILHHVSTNNAILIQQNTTNAPEKTSLKHIVFGIASSANLWEHRKKYIKLWWRPDEMRGHVWLDKPVAAMTNEDEEKLLPPLRISEDTERFAYTNPEGQRAGIRISRIASETVRQGLEEGVRWLVMGDDDTVFVAENLVRVLSKYDHDQYYYVGSVSESHQQNIVFSYGMAYGGGGFAISAPLARAIAKVHDRCIERYPELYGSDDRMQACMAVLGVPLTKEPGFHQFDVYGSLFGLLAAHPVTPLVTMHHFDLVDPIFPKMTRVEALQHLIQPMNLDSAALMQQSICYDQANNWTVSVSWGYAVQVLRGYVTPREMERPSRTFLNWYRNSDSYGFAFNTRSVSRHYCQKPFVFYMSKAGYNGSTQQTVSEYVKSTTLHPKCEWRMSSPAEVKEVVVYKTRDPRLWDKSPRRNCCRVMPLDSKETMLIDVGACEENEIIDI